MNNDKIKRSRGQPRTIFEPTRQFVIKLPESMHDALIKMGRFKARFVRAAIKEKLNREGP